MTQTDDQEFYQLHQELSALTQRVGVLEAKLKQPIPGPAPMPPMMAKVKTKKVPLYPTLRGLDWVVWISFLFLGNLLSFLPIAGWAIIVLAIFWPWKKTETRTTYTPISATASVQAATPTSPHEPSQFEKDLARHWFSWLGIISLVVGITLLLNYALRDYGEIGRIITAYAAATMLFGLAAWFQRSYRGFGLTLQAGAWAVTFLATFALHSLPGAPVESPIIGGGLLLMVVALMAIAALNQRSQSLTAGAFLLGYIAAFTNDVSIFTLSVLVILSAGAVLVATSQRWLYLIVAANLATFLVHGLWVTGLEIDLSAQFGLAIGFLTLEALLFGAAHWLTDPAKDDERYLVIIGTVLNLSLTFFLLQLTIVRADSNFGWMVSLYLALVTVILALTGHLTPSKKYFSHIYWIFAISFLAIALAQKYHGQAMALGWLLESAAVTIIGAILKHRTIRLMGYIVTVAAVLMYLSLLPSVELFGTVKIHARLIVGGLAVLLYGLTGWYLRSIKSILPKDERYTPLIYGWLTVGLITALIGVESNSSLISITWGIEGIILFGLGFALHQVAIRQQGLAVLVITIAKVYLYDVSKLDPGYRILSFVILGIILLAIGFLYNRWRQNPNSFQKPRP